MKFSISIAMADPAHYGAMAQAAEAHGYHAAVIPDSIFYSEQCSAKYPYTADGSRMWGPATPFVEPFVAAASMAAVTETLFFYTSVIKLPVRAPLLVAKQTSSLAAISGDRFGLGVGLGWLPEEFEWCQTEYRTRGKRANEALEILRLVLSGEQVEYEGEHYQFGKLQMSPAPGKPVPIYIGGHSKPGLERAAKYGDGWSSAMTTEKQLRELIGELEARRQRHGRSHLPFEIQVVCTDVYDIDGFKRLEEAGVTDVICMPWLMYGGPLTGGELQPRVDGIARFAEDVMRKMG